MANEKRLIDAMDTTIKISKAVIPLVNAGCSDEWVCQKIYDKVLKCIAEAPTVDAVELPCKIGDFVWAIRSYKGKKHPQRGIVSDMFYMNDMTLQIVVKHVARGKWGETVFATDKEAYEAIGERKDND